MDSTPSLPPCDWRVNVRNCQDSEVHANIKLAGAVLHAVALLVVAVMLSERFKHKIRLWTSVGPGLDATYLTIWLYALTRTIDSFLIYFDVYPNYVARHICSEIGWCFLFGAFVLFLVSIAQALPRTYLDAQGRTIHAVMPPARVIYTTGVVLFITPFVTNLILSGVIGFLHDTAQWDAENATIIAHYILWASYCITLVVAYIYIGRQLLRVIDLSMKDTVNATRDLTTAVRRIKLLVFVSTALLLVYSGGLVVFCAIRLQLLSNLVMSAVFSSIWNCLTAVAIMFFGPVIIYLERSMNLRAVTKSMSVTPDPSLQSQQVQRLSVYESSRDVELSPAARDLLQGGGKL